MDGEMYIPPKDVMALTYLKKSQLYKLVKQKKMLTDSEVVGANSRHKIKVRSVFVWLAAKNQFHQAEADKFARSYKILKKRVEDA